jgi:hypothetical protein
MTLPKKYLLLLSILGLFIFSFFFLAKTNIAFAGRCGSAESTNGGSEYGFSAAQYKCARDHYGECIEIYDYTNTRNGDWGYCASRTSSTSLACTYDSNCAVPIAHKVTRCNTSTCSKYYQSGWSDIDACRCYSTCTPVDGGWSGWSACSGGRQTRTCNHPSRSCGGSACSGSSSRNCSTPCSPVNGGWSDYGACSCPAGTKTRTCNSPAPSCDGNACAGSRTASCACPTPPPGTTPTAPPPTTPPTPTPLPYDVEPGCRVTASIATFTWPAVAGTNHYELDYVAADTNPGGNIVNANSTTHVYPSGSCTTGPLSHSGCGYNYGRPIAWAVRHCSTSADSSCSSWHRGPDFTSADCTLTTPTPIPTVTPIPPPVVSDTTIHIYNDPNGDSTSMSPYTGGGVGLNIAGAGAGSVTVNASGTYIIPNITTGSTITIATLPTGYEISPTDTDTKTATPPDAVVNFYIQPHTITGNIFIDDGIGDGIAKNGKRDGTESLYAASTITVYAKDDGGNIIASDITSTGAYSLSLISGTYFISYSPMPTDYEATPPFPPTRMATVGSSCDYDNSYDGTCDDATGSISNLNFGIIPVNFGEPWIQTTGGDVYLGNGVTQYSRIPETSTCTGGKNMSIPNGSNIAHPGIIETGSNGETIDFAGGQASPNPWNWVVGQNAYPEKINISITAYYQKIKDSLPSGFTPKTLMCDTSNCDLAAGLTQGQGIYFVNSNNLTLNSTYTFAGNNDYVILVNGNLIINTKILVDPGSTVLFAAKKDIIVGKDVGESDPNSTSRDLEGYYSAGIKFYIDGANTCPGTQDKRLNMQGAIVANADGSGIGAFEINRDMCNNSCPVLSIQARPDFVINAPATYLHTTIIQQEVAP